MGFVVSPKLLLIKIGNQIKPLAASLTARLVVGMSRWIFDLYCLGINAPPNLHRQHQFMFARKATSDRAKSRIQQTAIRLLWEFIGNRVPSIRFDSF